MKFIGTLFFFSSTFFSFAGPGTYYNSIDTTKSCAAFKTILKDRLRGGSTYLQYSDVDNNYNLTDLKPSEIGGGDAIVDRYCSENPTGLDYCVFPYPTGFCGGVPPDTGQCVCYNKEHVFPQSWFGSTYPAYSDIHLVWPCDNRVNTAKSNYPLGNAKNTYFYSRNGAEVGQSDDSKNFGYTGSNVFEPIDSFKGDFARAYLFVVTRYQDSLVSWQPRSTANNVLSGNTYPGLDPWILQICVQWHKLDPPNVFERSRNDAVGSIQGNRNPYIDYPHWVEKIFGVNGISAGCVASAVKVIKQSDFSVYPNPANNGFVQVRLRNFLTEPAELQVLDVLGRKWQSETISPNLATHAVNISSLPKGMYWIQINYKTDVSAVPFVVQ